MKNERLVTDVVEAKELSSLKMRFDCGLNQDGKSIIKSRTYSNVKAGAASLDVYNVAETLASLQQYDVLSVVKQDNTSLNA
ncbi:MAG: DUF1659 domain-containing protein [Peptostreptococcaceae bacterium]